MTQLPSTNLAVTVLADPPTDPPTDIQILPTGTIVTPVLGGQGLLGNSALVIAGAAILVAVSLWGIRRGWGFFKGLARP